MKKILTITCMIFSCLQADDWCWDQPTPCCPELGLQGGLFYGNIIRPHLRDYEDGQIADIEDRIRKKIKGACLDFSWNCISIRGICFNWEIFDEFSTMDSYRLCLAQGDIDLRSHLISFDPCNLTCITGVRAAYIKEGGRALNEEVIEHKTKTIGPYCGLQFTSCGFIAKCLTGVAYARSKYTDNNVTDLPYSAFVNFYHVFGGIHKQIYCIQCEIGYQLDNWCFPEFLDNELPNENDVRKTELGWHGLVAKLGVSF